MKVLIYCTKAKPILYGYETLMTNPFGNGRRFILNGKVCAMFEWGGYEEVNYWEDIRQGKKEYILNNSCLTKEQFINYIQKSNGHWQEPVYAWHIDNLQIFDEPVELCDLSTTLIPKDAVIKTDNYGVEYFYTKDRPAWNIYFSKLTKAPQSYQYVYYNGEKCLLLPIKSEWVHKILNGEKTIEIRKSVPKEVR